MLGDRLCRREYERRVLGWQLASVLLAEQGRCGGW